MLADEPFLQAILENPEDDAPRLIYADWLEEQGDPRAEFIRVQCELARLPAKDPRLAELKTREQELLTKHKTAWCTPVAMVAGGTRLKVVLAKLAREQAEPSEEMLGFPQFRRGFIEEIRINCYDVSRLPTQLENLFRLAPVRQLGLRILDADSAMTTLARCHHLVHLTGLVLPFNGIGDRGVRALATSPYLANLTLLDLANNEITEAGVRALADSPYLTHLVSVNLRGNPIGPPDVERVLAESPHLAWHSFPTVARLPSIQPVLGEREYGSPDDWLT